MDNYAIARAESRISDLEFEIRRLKFDSDRLRSDVQRMEWKERTRLHFADDFLFPTLAGVAFAMAGVGFYLIVIRIFG